MALLYLAGEKNYSYASQHSILPDSCQTMFQSLFSLICPCLKLVHSPPFFSVRDFQLPSVSPTTTCCRVWSQIILTDESYMCCPFTCMKEKYMSLSKNQDFAQCLNLLHNCMSTWTFRRIECRTTQEYSASKCCISPSPSPEYCKLSKAQTDRFHFFNLMFCFPTTLPILPQLKTIF